MNKFTINLLQPELTPDKPLLTLPRVLSLWVLTFVLMLGAVFTLQINEQALAKESISLVEEKRQQENTLAQLQSQLASHKADSALNAKRDTLHTVIENKKTILAYLTNTEETYINGFAKAMSELANIHNRNVSLTEITISEQYVSFAGLARTAESVPAWLTNFDRSKVLSGRLFNHFQLSENDEKLIEFTVSSSNKKEDN